MKKELCRDVVGTTVRLLREVKTDGGRTFPMGIEMRVYGTHHGRFHLEVPALETSGPGWSCRPGVRRVHRKSFEIIGYPVAKP